MGRGRSQVQIADPDIVKKDYDQHECTNDQEDSKEDDIWGNSEDEEDFLQQTQKYVDQEERNPPSKDDLDLSLTIPTTTQEDGQEDVGGALGALGQGCHRNNSTTTPCKGNGMEDLEGSTALYEVWDCITPSDRVKAFELWTSPASMRTPTILKLLDDKRTDRQTEEHHPVCLVSSSQGEVLRQGVTSVNEIGTIETGKPFPLYDTNQALIGDATSVGGDDSNDVSTPPSVEQMS